MLEHLVAGPLPRLCDRALAGEGPVRELGELRDGGRAGGVLDMHRGQGRDRVLVQCGRCHGGDRFGVRGIAAVGDHEGVLSHRGGVQELLGAGAAHGAGVGPADHRRQSEPIEGALVGAALILVGDVQALVGHVEGIGVLHDELAGAQQPGPGPGLVAVLRLDLVQHRGQILVGGEQVLHREGEHLLVSGGEQVVVLLAVLQPEQGGAVLLPPPGGLVGLTGLQRGEQHLLAADPILLLAHDLLDLAQHLQPQRQPGVHPGGAATDVARTHQQPVARDLGVGRVLPQGADEGRGQTDHGAGLSHGVVRGGATGARAAPSYWAQGSGRTGGGGSVVPARRARPYQRWRPGRRGQRGLGTLNGCTGEDSGPRTSRVPAAAPRARRALLRGPGRRDGSCCAVQGPSPRSVLSVRGHSPRESCRSPRSIRAP